ncbi:MAG: hypothetical protein GKS06_15930 [Acidobacteria bacterium]|nr:hypothetical protein [Acidobacteriota bacterium]
MSNESQFDSFLPLHPLHFRILVVLQSGPLYGYRIVKELEARGAGPMQPANLYRRIRDLKRDRLLVEVPAPEEATDQRDRKFFELSDLGRDVLAAEIVRLHDQLAEAGASGPRPEPTRSR